MATKKFLNDAGLARVADKVNEKLKVVSTMPLTPFDGQVVLYVGATTASYTQGGIYLYNANDTEWILLSSVPVDLTPYKKIFTGTQAEWNQLTLAEKKEYDEADLTDDLAGGELVVTDAVTDGDLNPVTSNAVANHIVVDTWTNTEAYTVPANGYDAKQTGIDSTKSGYILIGVTATTGLDAIVTGYRMFDNRIRITFINGHSQAQTIAANSCTVKAIWMKN